MLLWEHSVVQRLLTLINSTPPFYHRYFARPFYGHEMYTFMGIYTFFLNQFPAWMDRKDFPERGSGWEKPIPESIGNNIKQK